MIAMDYVTNGIGLSLMIMLVITNRQHFLRGEKTKHLLSLILVTMVTCVTEILFCALNGVPGKAVTVLLYLLEFWSFFANILMSYFWIRLECVSIKVQLSRPVEGGILVIDGIGTLVLLVNFFYPLVYRFENNVYIRCDFFWVALAVGGLNIIIALIIYGLKVRRERLLIPFRMGLFVIPLVLGIVVQTLFYGVTLIWVGVAIGITGMASSFKNGLIFLDPLTGVFNRTYLEKVAGNINSRDESSGAGIMVDLNDFKTINDTYGHQTGDEALVTAAGIFTEAVGKKGVIIRSGGDEFILLIDSVDPGIVTGIINRISAACDDFTEKNRRGYRLSVSMGWAKYDKKEENFDNFLKRMDQQMYKMKEEYHRIHRTTRT